MTSIDPKGFTARAPQTAARGTVYLTAAKAYFVVSGMAIYLFLPRILSARDFGLYSVVAGIASVINAVVVTATLQTVSRFVSEHTDAARAIRNKALKLQIVLGGGTAAVFAASAPVISHYLNDPELTGYLRIAALVTLCYAFYSVYLGQLNGLRSFFEQASVDISYSTFKAVFVIGLAAIGLGVAGALGGWVAASLVVLLLAAFLTRGGAVRPAPSTVRWPDLVRFQTPVLLLTLIINLIQRIDLLMVKGLSSPDTIIASELAGYYSAAMNIANVTFQSIIAIPLVAFPFIADSTARGDRGATSQYVRQTVRASLLIMTLLAVVFASNAGGVLELVYRPEYQAGGHALSIAPFGMLFFGLFTVLTSIISATGQPSISAGVGVFTLSADVLLNALLIPRYGLLGAAIGSAIAMCLGASAAAVCVGLRSGSILSPASLGRVFLCGFAAYFIPRLLPASPIFLIPGVTPQALCYLMLLIGSRELRGEDFSGLRRMIAKG